MMVYTICYDIDKFRCIRYYFDKERTIQNEFEYFNIECCFIDFDDKVCEEISIEFVIEKFREIKRIDSLNVFSLHYHLNQNEVKTTLIECSRKFIFLMGVHHRQYRENAFYMYKKLSNKFLVDSRIMINTIFFREVNLNYIMSYIEKSIPKILRTENEFMFFSIDNSSKKQSDRIKRNDKDPVEMMKDDLILYSFTVSEFSYKNKM